LSEYDGEEYSHATSQIIWSLIASQLVVQVATCQAHRHAVQELYCSESPAAAASSTSVASIPASMSYATLQAYHHLQPANGTGPGQQATRRHDINQEVSHPCGKQVAGRLVWETLAMKFWSSGL